MAVSLQRLKARLGVARIALTEAGQETHDALSNSERKAFILLHVSIFFHNIIVLMCSFLYLSFSSEFFDITTIMGSL